MVGDWDVVSSFKDSRIKPPGNSESEGLTIDNQFTQRWPVNQEEQLASQDFFGLNCYDLFEANVTSELRCLA